MYWKNGTACPCVDDDCNGKCGQIWDVYYYFEITPEHHVIIRSAKAESEFEFKMWYYQNKRL